jgi:hypothetical protein
MARTQDEIIKDIRNVECGLSPENLTCDGELPRSQWQAKARRLEAKKRELIKELGREPSYEEIWGTW